MYRLVMLLSCLLLVFAPGANTARADNEMLDTRFGDGGFLRLGMKSGNWRDEIAVAACPGPGDTEVIVGMQIGGRQVTLMRLFANGELDSSFGSDGLSVISVPRGDINRRIRALCQGNGRVVIAQSGHTSGGVHVFRFGTNGALDPTFGSGGVLDLTTEIHHVHGLDQTATGELLLTGGSNAAYIVRVHPNGVLRDNRTIAQAGPAAGAAYDGSGSLWVVGEKNGIWWWRRLNANDLSGEDVVTGPNDGLMRWFNGTRMVRPGVMVAQVAARDANQVTMPRLLVLRAGGAHEIVLPASPASIEVRGHGVQAMENGSKVLVAAGMLQARGFYFSLVDIGGTAAQDAVDTSFGNGGSSIVRYAADHPSCDDRDTFQEFSRISLWDGKPVFVGLGDANCLPYPDYDSDLLIGRLRPLGNHIFSDGFEP